MNIDAIIQQLSAFRQAYGDLPTAISSNGVYTRLDQAPWLAYATGAIPGPTTYVVVFGSPLSSSPPVPIPGPIVY